jgi:FkbM family methyltransferase
MWLYKGARSVIAVEPVPLHFQYLEKNVAGLPVTCLNVSLAVQLPKISNHDGSIKYGLLDETIGDSLDVPVMQLTELVEKYEPTVVKLNCEGCEHYVLEELSQIPRLGAKKIAVQFHDIKGRSAYESLVSLEKKLGISKKTAEKWTTDFSGKKIKTITVYWEL